MGAWGTDPWENDRALDWLFKIEALVWKELKPALKPLTPQKVLVFPSKSNPRLPHRPRDKSRAAQAAWRSRLETWKKKRRGRVKTLPTVPGYCQHEALAAVDVVLALPALYHHRPRPPGDENLVQISERVLLNLKKDEAFIAAWRDPKQYLAVLDRQLGRVRRVLRAQRHKEQERLDECVKRVKRLTKKNRDKIYRDSARSYYGDIFQKAFKLVDGRELQNPPNPPRRHHRIPLRKQTRRRK